jgi:hypothetical protein
MKDRRHHHRDHRREDDDTEDCVQEKKHLARPGLHASDGPIPRQDKPGIEPGVRPADDLQVRRRTAPTTSAPTSMATAMPMLLIIRAKNLGNGSRRPMP